MIGPDADKTLFKWVTCPQPLGERDTWAIIYGGSNGLVAKGPAGSIRLGREIFRLITRDGGDE